jgi:hypothetical protein
VHLVQYIYAIHGFLVSGICRHVILYKHLHNLKQPRAQARNNLVDNMSNMNHKQINTQAIAITIAILNDTKSTTCTPIATAMHQK